MEAVWLLDDTCKIAVGGNWVWNQSTKACQRDTRQLRVSRLSRDMVKPGMHATHLAMHVDDDAVAVTAALTV